MVAAHLRADAHGQAGVGHAKERGRHAHEELEEDDDVDVSGDELAGDEHPSGNDEQPEQTGEGEDGTAAEAIEVRSKADAEKAADKKEGGNKKDGGFGKQSLGFEESDGEGVDAAVSGGPAEVENEQASERAVSEHGHPGNGLGGGARFEGDRDVRDAFEIGEADGAHNAADEEDEGELPGFGSSAEDSGGHEESEATGGADKGLFPGEEFAANLGRDEESDPGKPGATGDAAGEVEQKKEKENEREAGGGIEKGFADRDEGNDENEGDAQAPAAEDETFVTEAVDVIGGGDLADDQQGHHAGDDAEDSGAGTEVLCVKDHWAAEHGLKGESVKSGEDIRVRETNRFSVAVTIQGSKGVARNEENSKC